MIKCKQPHAILKSPRSIKWPRHLSYVICLQTLSHKQTKPRVRCLAYKLWTYNSATARVALQGFGHVKNRKESLINLFLFADILTIFFVYEVLKTNGILSFYICMNFHYYFVQFYYPNSIILV